LQGNCNSNCSSASTYYVALTRQCLNCSASCYSCQGPLSTDCLSCKPPLSLFNGQCLTTCPFGYYSSSTYVCKQCILPCASCSLSSINCTACISPYFMQRTGNNMICVTSCSASFYLNTTTQSCSPCHLTCLTCSGPTTTQCTSCSSGSYLLQKQCMSSCPSGTVLIQQATTSICRKCSLGCANCTVSTTSSLSTKCTLCLPNYYLYRDSCLSVCPAGTYASPTSFNCNSCNLVGCQSCIFNSSMSVQCTICQAGYFFLAHNATCVTTCPSEYMLSNSQCVLIPVCRNYIYNNLCLISCPTSTYAVTSPTKACVSCSSNCMSCQNSSSCIQCSNTTYLYYNITNTSSCISYCPTGLYADSNSRQCNPCANNCLTCYQTNNQITCTACTTGYVLLEGQCA
jgi:proprotein convertase subtilisin/kexin type 5